MTTPTDIRRLLARINTLTTVAEARLDAATESLRRNTADGYPTTASGTYTGPRATSQLTPTEAAAAQNLGDLHNEGDRYHPGPSIMLDDLAIELRAALMSLRRADTVITDAGVPPFITDNLRCQGRNHIGCPTHDYTATGRTDHLCIDCGRIADTNARRLRRRSITTPPPDNPCR